MKELCDKCKQYKDKIDIRFCKMHSTRKVRYCMCNECYENRYKPKKPYFEWKGKTEKEKLERLKYVFDSKVIKKDGCWDWKCHKVNNKLVRYNPYPTVGKMTMRANRVSWLIHNGPIPEGMFVLHKCDNPRCTNPEHLFLGTSRNNLEDMYRKGRANPSKGDAHYLSKLSEEKVKKIRKLLSEGISQSKIGKMFGVCRATIANIKYDRSWKHVI